VMFLKISPAEMFLWSTVIPHKTLMLVWESCIPDDVVLSRDLSGIFASRDGTVPGAGFIRWYSTCHLSALIYHTNIFVTLTRPHLVLAYTVVVYKM
jgi:hypothetical protein